MSNFFSRPNLSNKQFRQILGSVLELDGTTDFRGVLKSKGIEIDSNIDTINPNELDNYYLGYDTNTQKIILKEVQGATDRDVTSMFNVGAIEIGDVIPEGTSLTDFIELLLTSIFEPTFVAPSASFTINPTSTTYEVGDTQSITYTLNFNRGQILGNNVGGVWNPSAEQDKRAGIANKYIIDGDDLDLTNNKIINMVINQGTNIINGTIQHDQGPQPLRSDGSNFNAPLAAGDINASRTINGMFRTFYGVREGEPTTSNDIRTLSGSVFDNVNTFSFQGGTGATKTHVIAIADSIGKTISSITTSNNENITNNFNETTINVDDAGGVSRLYKLFTFTSVVDYNVTITVTLT